MNIPNAVVKVAGTISSVICVKLESDHIFPSCFWLSPQNTDRTAIRSKVSTFILKQRILDLTHVKGDLVQLYFKGTYFFSCCNSHFQCQFLYMLWQPLLVFGKGNH
jgi:hypothetical protein